MACRHAYTTTSYVQEPTRAELAAYEQDGTTPPREAFVILTQKLKSTPNEVLVDLGLKDGTVKSWDKVRDKTALLVFGT